MPVDEPTYPVNLLLARPSGARGGRRRGRAPARCAGLLEGGADVITVVAPDVIDELARCPGHLSRSARTARAKPPATGSSSPRPATRRSRPRSCGRRRAGRGLGQRGRRPRALHVHAAGPRPARRPAGHRGHRRPQPRPWRPGCVRRLEQELGPEYEALLDLLADARRTVLAEGRPTEGLDWQAALDSGMLDLVREGRLAEAEGAPAQACLSSSSD